MLPKVAVALVAIAVLGYLFVNSLESTRTEPYSVSRAQVGPWELVLEPAEGYTAPLLSVRTDTKLVADLFTQMFNRTMESINRPETASIPIVLHGEFDRGLAPRMKPGELLAAARAAGLETASHELRCLAHRRISEPGMTRQTYFAMVDSPSIVAFRAQLAGVEQIAPEPVLMVLAGVVDKAAHGQDALVLHPFEHAQPLLEVGQEADQQRYPADQHGERDARGLRLLERVGDEERDAADADGGEDLTGDAGALGRLRGRRRGHCGPAAASDATAPAES